MNERASQRAVAQSECIICGLKSYCRRWNVGMYLQTEDAQLDSLGLGFRLGLHLQGGHFRLMTQVS